ncbi:LOW QUALITY PROTEIN: uncharacterized protein cfap221 [Pholidichthys leucotaenia]
MEVAQTLPRPARRRGTPLPLSQLVEEGRGRASVPNHLLETKIYANLKSNGLIQAEPSELHFSGFEIGKDYVKILKLINTSSEVMNIHIIPTQTKNFHTTYTKKYRLIPGLDYTLKVKFCPDEWRYYYDCVRVHCKGEDNLLIPVHGYPVIDDLHFPPRIDLPAVPLGQSICHTIPLRCSCPADFEFHVYVIQPHKAFSIHPLTGVIPANGEVKITVTFHPTQYETSHTIIQLVVSQFNTKPYLCTVTGSCAPHLALRVMQTCPGLWKHLGLVLLLTQICELQQCFEEAVRGSSAVPPRQLKKRSWRPKAHHAPSQPVSSSPHQTHRSTLGETERDVNTAADVITDQEFRQVLLQSLTVSPDVICQIPVEELQVLQSTGAPHPAAIPAPQLLPSVSPISLSVPGGISQKLREPEDVEESMPWRVCRSASTCRRKPIISLAAEFLTSCPFAPAAKPSSEPAVTPACVFSASAAASVDEMSIPATKETSRASPVTPTPASAKPAPPHSSRGPRMAVDPEEDDSSLPAAVYIQTWESRDYSDVKHGLSISDVCTAGVAKMLIKDTHKLSSKELKEALSSGSMEENNHLKWQVHLGMDPMTEKAGRQVIEEREIALQDYMVKMGDLRQEESFAAGQPKMSFRRVLLETGQAPEGAPSFQFYTTVKWELRQRLFRLFQQAARKVVIRCRIDRRLASLKKLEDRRKNLPLAQKGEEEKTFDLSSVRVFPSFPTFSHESDPLDNNNFVEVPVEPIDVTVMTQFPTFKHQSRQKTDELASFEIRAQSPKIVKPKVDKVAAENVETKEAASLSFSTPDGLLKLFLANPLRIFNPASELQTYKPTPKYLDSDLEFHLSPYTR